MGIRFSFTVAAIGAMLVCVPQAQARDMFGSKMYNVQRNAENRLSDSWNRHRDSGNSLGRDSGWGRDNSSRNWLRGNNDERDYYTDNNSRRSPYENIYKQDKRFDTQKLQAQWEKQWNKQGEMGQNFNEKLQKQYDRMTKQNSRMIYGNSRSFSNYGF